MAASLLALQAAAAAAPVAALARSFSPSSSAARAPCGSFAAVPSSAAAGMRRRGARREVHVAALEDADPVALDAPAGDEHGVLPSGEWPENLSMWSYEDLSAHYAPAIFKKEAQPESIVADIMAKQVWSAYPDTPIKEVSHHFDEVTGLPVVNKGLECVGVLSKKDVSDASPEGVVGDVMSTPPITITADKTVRDAAILMLREKVHRIPVVNESKQLVGIVTRSDIFTALEGLPSRD